MDDISTLDDSELENQLTLLTSKLDGLHLEVEKLERKKDKVTKEIQWRQNPVHKLPFEILGLIFRFYLYEPHTVQQLGEDTPSPDANPEPNPFLIKRLLLVSRSWFNACVNHQSLWTRIHFHGPFRREYLEGDKRFIKACYERSGDFPLEVVFNTCHFQKASEDCWDFHLKLGAVTDQSTHDPDISHKEKKSCSILHHSLDCMFWKSHTRTAVELLSALFHSGTERWGSFHFEWPHLTSLSYPQCQYYDGSILDLITEDCGGLGTLYIDNSGGNFKNPTRLDSRLGSLRDLELIDIGWDTLERYHGSPSLPTVKKLALEFKDCSRWREMTNTCLGSNWLQKFPRLEHLSLRNRDGTNSLRGGVSMNVKTTYIANSIRTLILMGYVPPQLLGTLRTPLLQKFHIQCGTEAYTSAAAILFIGDVTELGIVKSATYLELLGFGEKRGGAYLRLLAPKLLALINSMIELEKIKIDSGLRHWLQEEYDKHDPENAGLFSVDGKDGSNGSMYIRTNSGSFMNLRNLLGIL